MTRQQLAEKIYEIEADKFGFDKSSKNLHVHAMLNGFGKYIKPMKKADLEKRLADLKA